MILRSLNLENFKQYDQLQIEFRDGLTGIVGKNGAGKSTLFEAVLICFFGSSNTDKEYYKSAFADAKAKVKLELVFEINNQTYQLVREFRGKVLTHHANLYDAQKNLLATSASAVNNQIAEIIGMDKEAFTRSIFSGQKELGILSSTRGEERKKMVRKMTGLNKLDKIQKLIREDRNSFKRQIEGQEALLLSAEEVKESKKVEKEAKEVLANKNKELKKLMASFKTKNEAYLKHKSSYDSLSESSKLFNSISTQIGRGEEKVIAYKKELEQKLAEEKNLVLLQKDIKTKAPQIKKFEAQKKELSFQNQIQEKYNRKVELENKKIGYAERLAEIQKNIKTLEKVLAPQKELEDKVKAFDKKVHEQTSLVTHLQVNIKDLRQAQGRIQGKIDVRQKQLRDIEKIGKEADCPTCLQPLIHSYDQTLEKLNAEIASYEKEHILALDKQVREAEQKQEAAQKQLDKVRKEEGILKIELSKLVEKQKEINAQGEALEKGQQMVKDIDQQIAALGKLKYNPADHEKLRTTVSAFEPEYLSYNISVAKVAQLDSIRKSMEEIKAGVKSGETWIASQNKELKKLKFSPQQFAEAKSVMDNLEEEKEVLRNQKEELEQSKNKIQNQIVRLEETMDGQNKIKAAIATKRADYQQLNSLDGIFQGFNTYVLERIKPTITQHAGSLFNRITKGRYEGIHVDNNFEFQIYDDGSYYPISRFSGGEIDLANLCLRIGISKAISELSGSSYSISFLGFDEIFGSQDEGRRMEIMYALDHLKEQYRQIYIISHIDEVQDHFEHILQVSKEGEGSRVSWV